MKKWWEYSPEELSPFPCTSCKGGFTISEFTHPSLPRECIYLYCKVCRDKYYQVQQGGEDMIVTKRERIIDNVEDGVYIGDVKKISDAKGKFGPGTNLDFTLLSDISGNTEGIEGKSVRGTLWFTEDKGEISYALNSKTDQWLKILGGAVGINVEIGQAVDVEDLKGVRVLLTIKNKETITNGQKQVYSNVTDISAYKTKKSTVAVVDQVTTPQPVATAAPVQQPTSTAAQQVVKPQGSQATVVRPQGQVVAQAQPQQAAQQMEAPTVKF